MKPLRILVLLLVTLPVAACNRGSNPEGKTYGKYTLQDTRYDQVDQAKAKANADDMLTQLQNQKDICLIGLWAYNPPAILSAVKAAKKEGIVHIVGFDED